jgi:hypothetical protein
MKAQECELLSLVSRGLSGKPSILTRLAKNEGRSEARKEYRMNREKFQAVLALSRTVLLLVIFASVSNGDGFAQSIETFDVPNAIQTNPTAINAAGQITGSYADANSRHGFVRDRDGKILTFDPSGSIYTSPTSINSKGQITGGYKLPDKSTHGFLREQDGTITSFDASLGPGGSDDFFTLAINPAGQLPGWYGVTSWDGGPFLREPDGTITAFDCGGQPCGAVYPQAINAMGQITGVSFVFVYFDGRTLGFLRQPDGTIVRFFASPEPPTKIEPTFPRSINAAGQITGWVGSPGGGGSSGFLRQADGTITRFRGTTSARETFPAAINAEGQITGYFYMPLYLDPHHTAHGFLREDDGTIVMFDVPNATATQATAMNDAGDITGSYIDASGNAHGFIRYSQDTIPPVTTAAPSPGPNSNGWNSTDVTVTLSSTDNEPGGTGVKQIQYALTGAQTLDTQTVVGITASVTISAEGLTTLTYFGTDKAGNVEQAKTLTVQIDKTPPVISGMPAPGCALWPPNHKLVGVATVTAADALSGVAPGSFEVTGSSNEPSEPNNPDVVITPNGSGGYVIQLRARRLGSGTGRIYTLNATATDLAGNTVTATAECVVPKTSEDINRHGRLITRIRYPCDSPAVDLRQYFRGDGTDYGSGQLHGDSASAGNDGYNAAPDVAESFRMLYASAGQACATPRWDTRSLRRSGPTE